MKVVVECIGVRSTVANVRIGNIQDNELDKNEKNVYEMNDKVERDSGIKRKESSIKGQTLRDGGKGEEKWPSDAAILAYRYSGPIGIGF